MSEEEYAKEKLAWVTRRLAILDEIDEKLKEMKQMAEYARDNELPQGEKDELNRRINKVGREIQVLHEKDKDFVLDWQ